jgi:hypothetical protein
MPGLGRGSGEDLVSADYWTDDRLAQLRQLIVVEGATFSQAAAEIGCTKNMAVGKAWRLGLQPSDDAPQVRNQSGVRAYAARRRAAAARLSRAIEFPPPGRCVFPMGDPDQEGFGFCGGHAGGNTYCAEHDKATRLKPEIAEAA